MLQMLRWFLLHRKYIQIDMAMQKYILWSQQQDKNLVSDDIKINRLTNQFKMSSKNISLNAVLWYNNP